MKVLLINTFWIIRKKHNIWGKIAVLIPPIGLMSLAACLEREGIDVDILESNAPGFDLALLSKKKLQQYDFIGISATTNVIHNAYAIINHIKSIAPQSKVIVGGVHATILPEEVMQHDHVDFVIIGEGEQVLCDFLRTDNITKIPNVYYRDQGKIRFTFCSPQPLDINELPIPAYHKIDFDHYSLALGSYQRLPGIGIVISRGCPSACTFCHGPLLGRKVRIRSPEKIIAEIKLLIEKYHIKEIAFYDDNFTIHKPHTLELCRKMLEGRLDITWSCFSKVTFVDKEMLQLMKKAGCHQILYGIESGSPMILKNIKKHISLDQAEKIVKLTQKYQIDVRAAFMLGNPGETEETLQQTLDFAVKLNPDIAVFNITTPFPGTAMFEWAQKNGYLLTTNWEEYDLSKPVMKLPTVSNDMIMKYYFLSYRRFYFRFSYIIRQLCSLSNWRLFFVHAKAAIKLLSYLIRL